MSPRPGLGWSEAVMTTLGLTPEQLAFREAVAGFAGRIAAVPDGSGQTFSSNLWRRCAEFGIHGLPVPEEFGGSAADPVSIALALETLGYLGVDNGLLFSVNAQMWSCTLPLVRFGSTEQKARYLRGLCDGSLVGVHAMTEPESGSDALSLATTAVPDGDGSILNGSKTFITNAPVADLFIVFATVDRNLGFAGLSAFLVDGGNEGLSVGPPFRKMGLGASPMAEVLLTDCRVGPEALLGRLGAGMAMFNAAMDWERGFILASAVGRMQRQLELCVEHARDRHQFGQPIGRFQSVANRIVDMKVRVETSRLLLYQMARLRSSGKSASLESAMVKLHVSECYVASALDAVQIFGGAGYLVESGLEGELRDA